MATKAEITVKIVATVTQYRESNALLEKQLELLFKTGGNPNEDLSFRNHQKTRQQAFGALLVLRELFPKNPAWADTGWVC